MVSGQLLVASKNRVPHPSLLCDKGGAFDFHEGSDAHVGAAAVGCPAAGSIGPLAFLVQRRIALTTDACQSNLLTLGGSVKFIRWMLVLFLLGAAVCVGAVAGVDRPGTSFNEADLPVNLGLPAQPRVQDIRPVAVPVVLSPTLSLHCADCVTRSLVPEPAIRPSQHHPHSLHVLLCTFLI